MQSCWHAEMQNFSRLLAQQIQRHSLNKHSLFCYSVAASAYGIVFFIVSKMMCNKWRTYRSFVEHNTTEAPAKPQDDGWGLPLLWLPHEC